MTGPDDYRPGLETPFVWTGQSQRNWGLMLKVGLTCAVCVTGGFYFGRASVHQMTVTIGAAEKTASQDASVKKTEPAQSSQAAAVDSEKPVQSVPHDNAAVANTQQPQPATASATNDRPAASGGSGPDAAAARKTATSGPVRIINADAEKGRHEPNVEGQEKQRTHAAAPKKKAVAERQGEREKPTTERPANERDGAYVPPRRGFARNDAYVPPRTTYEREEDYPPPRAGYGPDRYGELWRSRRPGSMYDDYDPRDVPRDDRGYLRELRGIRGY